MVKVDCFTLLMFTFATVAVAESSFVMKDDACSMYDSCKVGEFFRTCSCYDDCSRYGTCCSDAPKFPVMKDIIEDFSCYSSSVPQPVYAKKTCSDDFTGEDYIRESCLSPNSSISDLMGNVLVFSNKTLTTYWNYNCAVCNNEIDRDISFWTVQVSCPLQSSGKRYDIKHMRKSMVYNPERDTWGIMDDGRFITCSLEFFQPPVFMEHFRYCTQDVISDCLEGWTDEDVHEKCLAYYGERKGKKTNKYYRNVYCALCNKIPLDELECQGRNYMPKFGKSNIHMIRVVFNLNPWIGEHSNGQPKCKNGFRYDPFFKKCRNIKCGIVHPSLEDDFCLATSSSFSMHLSACLFALSLLISLKSY